VSGPNKNTVICCLGIKTKMVRNKMCASVHKLLVMVMAIKGMKTRKKKFQPCIRVWTCLMNGYRWLGKKNVLH